MKLKEYSDAIKHTAIYPTEVGKIYSILGMIDEMGEVSEKLDSQASMGDLEDEVGDTLWYVTATIREFGFDDMFEWFDDNKNSQVNPDRYPKYLAKFGMQIGAQLAGRLKKIIRDENQEFTDEKVGQIKEYVTLYINNLILLVNKMDMDFDRILQGNIDKLIDRKERGVLKGEGDKR